MDTSDTSKLLIGIDGGQSTVKAALAAPDGRILSEGSADGLTHLSSQGSAERFVAHVGGAIQTTLRAAGIAPSGPPRVAAIGLVLTGVEAGTAEDAQVRALLPQCVHTALMDVQTDAVGALIGAFGHAPGIIAISGTGSIVLGQNRAGQRARAGGWGWLLGDEGSALAIGRNGLRAALAHADQSGPRTQLHDLFLQHFHIVQFADVKRIVHSSDFGARGFASLATVVSAAACANDDVAFDIIRNEAVLLAGQVVAVARRLQLAPAETCVAPMSGGFANIFGLRESFEHAFGIIAPVVRVVQPNASALQGAVWMAQRLIQNAT